MNQLGRYRFAPADDGGAVRAEDTRLGRFVSLELLEADASPDERARFERHARAAAAIDHPNVTAVLEAGALDGRLFVATEIAEGKSLREACEGASPEVVRGWLLDAARGLAATHAAGVLHRDVRADNIVVTRENVVKLRAFRFARFEVVGPASFRTRTLAASPTASVSPDTSQDARADQYAWATMAVELLGRNQGAWAPALRRATRRGRTGPFASMDALIEALASPPARPARLFLGTAALTIVAFGGVAIAFGWSRLGETTPRGRGAVAAASSSDAAPKAEPEPRVDAGPPLPREAPTVAFESSPRKADAGTAAPPVAMALIRWGKFADPVWARIESAFNANSARLGACLRINAPDGTPTTFAEFDVHVFPDGTTKGVQPTGNMILGVNRCLVVAVSSFFSGGRGPALEGELSGFRVRLTRNCGCAPSQTQCPECPAAAGGSPK